MPLAEQLHAAGLAVFPCYADKSPAVARGTDWRDVARLPPASLAWPSLCVGIPVPPGVVVLDLDTYKGATREAVEATLGCVLPWDAALIQHTPNGGQHYAFSVGYPVRNAQDFGGLRGFDIRAAGRGYAATGQSEDGAYVSAGHYGVFALAQPACLPPIPDAARDVLEDIPPPPVSDTVRTTADEQTLVEALGWLDPGCNREQWVRIGMALRAHYGNDDDGDGMALFDAWSRGEYWRDGCPSNYNPHDVPGQWHSFKPDGRVQVATLFYDAIQAGWAAPHTAVDASGAFSGPAADQATVDAVVARIHAHGSDARHTADLIAEIGQSGANPVQKAVLLAELSSVLSTDRKLTKALRQQLDAAAGVTSPGSQAQGTYGKSHSRNAVLFLETHYPNGTLVRCEEVWYRYTGKAWAELSDGDLRHQVAVAMAGSNPQIDQINGTVRILEAYAHRGGQQITTRPDGLTLFQNCVLRVWDAVQLPHDPAYFTTNILPYDFQPAAACPRWDAFLGEVFDGDVERIALLQEWFGYCLAGDYAHHKVLLMLGPTRSGKGTIGRMLERVVGAQNFSGGSLLNFTSDSFLDSLRTKAVLFIGDAEKRLGPKADQVVERIKRISGNDAVAFDRKYKSGVSCTLPTRITIAANSVPRMFDDSGALSDRILLVPFERSFLHQENLQLGDELAEEVEGVAVWALQGWARLQQQGRFTTPEASRLELDDLREMYSPLTQFLSEACTLTGNAGDRVDGSSLYAAYRAWAVRTGDDNVLPRKRFVPAFKDATRGRGCRYCKYRDGEDTVRGAVGLTVDVPEGVAGEAFKVHEGGAA